MREGLCTFDSRDDNSIRYNRGSEAGMVYDTTGERLDVKSARFGSQLAGTEAGATVSVFTSFPFTFSFLASVAIWSSSLNLVPKLCQEIQADETSDKPPVENTMMAVTNLLSQPSNSCFCISSTNW